jgi:hypothetical protein
VQQVSIRLSEPVEVPVLFYVIVALAILTPSGDDLCSWPVLGLRGEPARATPSFTPPRTASSTASWPFSSRVLILMLMWIIFAVRVFVGTAA